MIDFKKLLEKDKEDERWAKFYAEERRKAAEKLLIAKECPFIEHGVCHNDGTAICNLGYACDGCPYNKDGEGHGK